MNTNAPDLNITYYNQEYHHNTKTVPITITHHQPQQQQQQQPYQLYSSSGTGYHQICCGTHHPHTSVASFNYRNNFSISPPSSIASSLSSSQGSFQSTTSHILSTSTRKQQQPHQQMTSLLPAPPVLQQAVPLLTASSPSIINSNSWNFTWLVFMNEKWIPFDPINQTKLEQTLTVGGTFVDIVDGHFPDVRKVRVFPKNNYLSYLGVKYRLSRIMQPDAYSNHVGLIHNNNNTNNIANNSSNTYNDYDNDNNINSSSGSSSSSSRQLPKRAFIDNNKDLRNFERHKMYNT